MQLILNCSVGLLVKTKMCEIMLAYCLVYRLTVPDCYTFFLTLIYYVHTNK